MNNLERSGYGIVRAKKDDYTLAYIVLALAVLAMEFHYFVLPLILPAQASSIEQNEEICTHLEEYANGDEFISYCAGL